MGKEKKEFTVTIELATGEKCQRCWKILDEVGSNKNGRPLCNRCNDVIENMIKEGTWED